MVLAVGKREVERVQPNFAVKRSYEWFDVLRHRGLGPSGLMERPRYSDGDYERTKSLHLDNIRAKSLNCTASAD